MMGITEARMFQCYNFPMRGNYFSYEVASFPQYFCEDIFSFTEQELFVDCGAFDGDTLIAFAAMMWRIGRASWSAVAFEADKKNADLIERNLKCYGINCAKIICAAVGRDDTIASATSYFNCRQDGGYGNVQAVSLDKALRGVSPTFIKMDIEGYEQDALFGAKKLISAHRPKLAICSYHTSSQLLEVPLFILDNFPDYRLYMRHHSAGTLWETVCYAVPS
jgi:FkbM family methyltransferase